MNVRALDFTEGPIAKKMLWFAGPMFLSNLLQTSYQFVDSLWVGNLMGSHALAALSISSPITFAVLSFMIGINGTTLTILSQHRGQNDHEGIRKSLNAFVVILDILSLVLGLVGYFGTEFLLELIGTPPELLPLAKTYLQINFLGIVFSLGYNFISTVLRALVTAGHECISSRQAISYTGILLIFVCSLLISALVFLNAPLFIRMFVSDGTTITFGTSYLKVTAFSTFF